MEVFIETRTGDIISVQSPSIRGKEKEVAALLRKAAELLDAGKASRIHLNEIVLKP